MPLDAERIAILQRLAPLDVPPATGITRELEHIYAETWAALAREVEGGDLRAVDTIRTRSASAWEKAREADVRLAEAHRIVQVRAEADAIQEAGGHTHGAFLKALDHLFDNGELAFMKDRMRAMVPRYFRASVINRFIEAYETWGDDALDVPPLPETEAAASLDSLVRRLEAQPPALPPKPPRNTQTEADDYPTEPIAEEAADATHADRRRVRYEHAAFVIDAFPKRSGFGTWGEADRAIERADPPGGTSGEGVRKGARRVLKDFGQNERGQKPSTFVADLRAREREIRKRLAGNG